MFAKLNELRSKAWKFLSGGKVISAISHLVLVAAGCFIPAYPFYKFFGVVFGIIVFKLLSEGWAIFMTGREVLDYMKKKAKGDDIDHAWQDGLGDLFGPYLVSLAGWIAMLWLIFGQGG